MTFTFWLAHGRSFDAVSAPWLARRSGMWGFGSAPGAEHGRRWVGEREVAGTTIADLSRGRDVFVSKCSSCHALPAPTVKSADEWTMVIVEMGGRARLSSVNRDLVNRYLSSESERMRRSGG